MATKEDAAEQAKEFLRQVIKYRFWISIGVAALFAVIAYMVGSGPIRKQADDERTAITSAEKEVGNYKSPTIPTKEYMPIVQGKTQVLDKDVIKAWRTLFERQAPLLTWPDTVKERFRTWGRQWPEKENPRKVELAIVDYIADDAYPAYVSMVYSTCNPFNFETGTGIVVTPGQDALLRPTKFDPEHLPDLGKVWAAQERLWIQRTLLEVVGEVNKNAKTWDEAIIRQIVELEVGNPSAQDQRSLAKNDQLEESKGIYAKGEEPPADSAGGAAPGGSVSLPGGKGGMMGNLPGGAMGGGLGSAAASENVFYVKADSDKYKIMPFLMSVLIDQDRVQDFLVELENSPMWIQVKDFELTRPSVRVAKPEKGEEADAGMMGMMGMMGMSRGPSIGGMVGMGGNAQMQMQAQMQQSQRAQQGMMSGMTNMANMRGMGAATKPEKQGKSMKGVDTAKARAAKEKAALDAKGPTLFDPYFNIVQVRIYGQARFFQPPPEAPPAKPSPGDVAGATDAGAPAGEPVPKGTEPAAAVPAATATGPAEKPAPAPDAAPKKDATAKADNAPDAKADNPPAPATADADAKTPKNDPAAKTQPKPVKPKP